MDTLLCARFPGTRHVNDNKQNSKGSQLCSLYSNQQGKKKKVRNKNTTNEIINRLAFQKWVSPTVKRPINKARSGKSTALWWRLEEVGGFCDNMELSHEGGKINEG